MVIAICIGLGAAVLSPLAMSLVPYSEAAAEKAWSHPSSPRWVVVVLRNSVGTRIFSTLSQGTIGIGQSAHLEGIHPLNTYVSARPDHVCLSLPQWSRTHRRPPQDGESGLLDARNVLESPNEIIEDARGWPFRSLMCRLAFDNESKRWRALSWSGTLPLRGDDSAGRQNVIGPRVIPTSPIAAGLLLNAVCFSGMALLIVCAWKNLLAAVRWGRGCCSHCAYDLRGIDSCRCPECGEMIVPKGNRDTGAASSE